MPPVLNIFKIIIDYIWKVFDYDINFGGGFHLKLWYLSFYIIVAVVLIRFLTLDNSPFRADKVEKFSKKRGDKNV